MNNKLLITILATAFSGTIFATEVITTEEVTVLVEENEINAQEEVLKKLAALTAVAENLTEEEVAEITESQE